MTDPSPGPAASTHPAAPWLFRTSAFLWLIWGAVHILAGVMTVKQVVAGQTAEAIQAITSAVELSALQMVYPDALSAVLGQHGFNLGWFGVVTLVCSVFVWRRRVTAVYLAALVGGLADLGYFIFVDVPGYALPPGPQMTWICAGAIITGLGAVRLSAPGR